MTEAEYGNMMLKAVRREGHRGKVPQEVVKKSNNPSIHETLNQLTTNWQKTTEIAPKVNKDRSTVHGYLDQLQGLGIVEKSNGNPHQWRLVV